jgi:hypothetical protein
MTIINEFNTSEFPDSERGNKETLNERETYWVQKLKAATDSRLYNLIPSRISTEGKTREELEILAAKRFVIEEQKIKNIGYVYESFHLSLLEEEITEESWEERQTRLKESPKYYGHCGIHELKCCYCGRVFYAGYPYAKYCNYYCKMDVYIDRRRERKEREATERKAVTKYNNYSYSLVCQYCQKNFLNKRYDAKYCSESHRVLACYDRRK